MCTKTIDSIHDNELDLLSIITKDWRIILWIFKIFVQMLQKIGNSSGCLFLLLILEDVKNKMVFTTYENDGILQL